MINRIRLMRTLAFTLIMILGIVGLLFSRTIAAEDVVCIEDENLERVIRGALGKDSGMLTMEEIEGIEKLDGKGLGIKSLAGLEGITSIKAWDLRDNHLTEVDGLKNLVKADRLILDNNQLRNIDGLNNLRKINDLSLN